MNIRPAGPEDGSAIRAIHVAAFPTADEACLVEALIAAGDATLSLVAEQDGQIIGHLLCSRMKVEAGGESIRAVGLAPVAVRPQSQGRGIGAALIREALSRGRDAGEAMMFVLGEPEYYRRFGFSAETARPFASPYAGDYFMATDFTRALLPRLGRADYAPAFAALEQAE
jgi:putative acetyltransferase